VTLIIATCNSSAATMTADTRLSRNGKLLDDNSAKIGCATFSDARLLYAYTGLATVGAFQTRVWILESMLAVAKQSTQAMEAIRLFKLKATEDFASIAALKSLDAKSRMLTIVFAGFATNQPVAAIVSNFENFAESQHYSEAQDKFWFSGWPGRLGETFWTGSFGSISALSQDELSTLRSLVETGKPVDAIKGKAEAMIVAASKHPRSGGTVGANVLRASLPAAPGELPTGGFVSEKGGNSILLLDQFHFGGAIISGGTVSTKGGFPARRILKREHKRRQRERKRQRRLHRGDTS
jgi:hypothetical protein